VKNAEDTRARWLQQVGDTARQAMESGRTCYVAQFNLGGMERRPFAPYAETDGEDVAGAIQAIEQGGWHLEHIGYVYEPLKEKKTAFTGQNLVTGQIIGVYTFRRATS
jgi:hypothetical protein